MAGHIDVSLWYVLKGTRSKPLRYDRSEFHRAQWFHRDEVPFGRTDPQMGRFIMKLYQR